VRAGKGGRQSGGEKGGEDYIFCHILSIVKVVCVVLAGAGKKIGFTGTRPVRGYFTTLPLRAINNKRIPIL
jgi:hypothetical protein